VDKLICVTAEIFAITYYVNFEKMSFPFGYVLGADCITVEIE